MPAQSFKYVVASEIKGASVTFFLPTTGILYVHVLANHYPLIHVYHQSEPHEAAKCGEGVCNSSKHKSSFGKLIRHDQPIGPW